MHIRLYLKIKYFSRSEPKYSTVSRFGVGTKFCGVDDIKHFCKLWSVWGQKGNRFNHYHLKKCHGSEKCKKLNYFILPSSKYLTRDQVGTNCFISGLT